jgi:hypothetical protein
MAQQDKSTTDATVSAQIGAANAFEDGMALALWLHEDVNPQLKKWGKSHDRRVQLMAAVISDLVADAYNRQDWAGLNHMYDVWRKNDGPVEAEIVDDEPGF